MTTSKSKNRPMGSVGADRASQLFLVWNWCWLVSGGACFGVGVANGSAEIMALGVAVAVVGLVLLRFAWRFRCAHVAARETWS
jgi:hypothetical protein